MLIDELLLGQVKVFHLVRLSLAYCDHLIKKPEVIFDQQLAPLVKYSVC